MRYVQIIVDGVTYTLRQQANGEWTVTNKAPYVKGEYPIAVLATTEAGQVVEIDVADDSLLQQALILIVNEGATISGERMLNYYPEVIQKLVEFQALMKTEGFEVDFIRNDIELIVNEAYLLTMSERRISEWEKALGIAFSSGDSIEDRREVIIARIRGQGKLNTALINSIVSAFTNGTADSYFRDGTLYVDITPPPENKQYKFENVERELMKKIPAHIRLTVRRDYATWGEVMGNFTDWNSIRQLSSWEELATYVAPQ